MRKSPTLITSIATLLILSLACNIPGLLQKESPPQPLQTALTSDGEPGFISEVIIYSDPNIPLISHYEFDTSGVNIIEAVDLLGTKNDGEVVVEGALLYFVGNKQPWTLQFDEMVRVIDVQTPDGAAYHIEFENESTAKIEHLNENGQSGTQTVELGEDIKFLLDIIRTSAGTSGKLPTVFSAAYEHKPTYRDKSAPPPPQYDFALTAVKFFLLDFRIEDEMVPPGGIKVEVPGCEGVACISWTPVYGSKKSILLKTVHYGTVPVDENPPAALTKECESHGRIERIGIGVIGLVATIVGAAHGNAPMVVAGATFMSVAAGSVSLGSDTIGYRSCTELAQWQVAKPEFGALTSNVEVCVSHPHIEFANPCQKTLIYPFPVRQSEFGDHLVFDQKFQVNPITFDGICTSKVESSGLSPCDEDDDTSSGEGTGGETTTGGEPAIAKPIVQVEAEFRETLEGSDPPLIFLTAVKLTADFTKQTVNISIAGDNSRPVPWECTNPYEVTDIWDTAELFFTESFSAEFTTQLGPEGDFLSTYTPTGSTYVELSQPFTDENCIDQNDSSAWWSFGNTDWKNPAEGTITGYVTPDGWAEINTDWSVGSWDPIVGAWSGAGSVLEP